MSLTIGETDYRNSGHERLREAGILLEEEFYAGAVYLAGRAVEAMLRCLILKNDPELRTGKKSLDTGHDLRRMLTLVRELGVLRDGQGESALAQRVQLMGRLWFNNMRYVPTKKLQSIWWERGAIHRKRSLKAAVRAYYDSCSAVIKQCEVFYAKA